MIRQQKCGRNCRSVHRTEKVYATLRSVQSRRPPDVLHPRQGAKATFDGRNGCQKCFCVTFGDSNKAYAPYPALTTTRKGRKDIY